jgi:hypothetical protein
MVYSGSWVAQFIVDEKQSYFSPITKKREAIINLTG